MVNNMKTIKLLLLLSAIFLAGYNLKAQDLEIIAPINFKYFPVGTYELIIDFEVVNLSSQDTIIVFEKRTIDNLPLGWTSSLCFGELCFAPFVDSVATTPEFATPPVAPGDTLETSVHVFTDTVNLNLGLAHIQIEVGTFSNPNDRDTLDFYFTNDPSVDVEKEEGQPNEYILSQNYPNPFNPSTNINYTVKEGGLVTLKVYNILGVEVATLVNGYKPAGIYQTDFNAAKLSSGVYLYRLSVNGFTETRKMILEK
jgi:hypothetical protein